MLMLFHSLQLDTTTTTNNGRNGGGGKFPHQKIRQKGVSSPIADPTLFVPSIFTLIYCHFFFCLDMLKQILCALNFYCPLISNHAHGLALVLELA